MRLILTSRLQKPEDEQHCYFQSTLTNTFAFKSLLSQMYVVSQCCLLLIEVASEQQNEYNKDICLKRTN